MSLKQHIFTIIARCYQGYVRQLSFIQPVLLLLIRLYWGSSFVISGTSKLSNLERTATFFEGLHIPFPYMNALMAGLTESCGGLLLLIGLGVRISNIPLIVTMIVAYLTAHHDEVSDLYTFVTAPPFLHMFACILTLVFGPGFFSLDALFGSLFQGREAGMPSNNLQPQLNTAN